MSDAARTGHASPNSVHRRADSFAAAYRKLVFPDLERLCWTEGILITCGRRSFGEAVAIVMREAYRRGAKSLQHHLLLELDDIVRRLVLEATERENGTRDGRL